MPCNNSRNGRLTWCKNVLKCDYIHLKRDIQFWCVCVSVCRKWLQLTSWLCWRVTLQMWKEDLGKCWRGKCWNQSSDVVGTVVDRHHRSCILTTALLNVLCQCLCLWNVCDTPQLCVSYMRPTNMRDCSTYAYKNMENQFKKKGIECVCELLNFILWIQWFGMYCMLGWSMVHLVQQVFMSVCGGC